MKNRLVNFYISLVLNLCQCAFTTFFRLISILLYRIKFRSETAMINFANGFPHAPHCVNILNVWPTKQGKVAQWGISDFLIFLLFIFYYYSEYYALVIFLILGLWQCNKQQQRCAAKITYRHHTGFILTIA